MNGMVTRLHLGLLAMVLGVSASHAAAAGGQGQAMEGIDQSLQVIRGYYDQVREHLGGGSGTAPESGAAPTQLGVPFRPGYELEPSLSPRDPFALTEALTRMSSAGGTGLDFTPVNSKVKVPKLSLKGIIGRAPGQIAALLEMEGHGTYVVREGDTISLPDQGQNSVIKVQKIDRLSLIVQVGLVGQVIVIR